MTEKKSERKWVKNQYKHYDMVLKERMIREVGSLLDKLMGGGYMNKATIKADFGIDYKTTTDLHHAAPTCTFGTLRKFAYVIGFYIHQAEAKANAIPYEVKRQEELRKVNHDKNAFIAIYGIEATCVLELSNRHKDLREIVRQK